MGRQGAGQDKALDGAEKENARGGHNVLTHVSLPRGYLRRDKSPLAEGLYADPQRWLRAAGADGFFATHVVAVQSQASRQGDRQKEQDDGDFWREVWGPPLTMPGSGGKGGSSSNHNNAGKERPFWERTLARQKRRSPQGPGLDQNKILDANWRTFVDRSSSSQSLSDGRGQALNGSLSLVPAGDRTSTLYHHMFGLTDRARPKHFRP
jgi:hypothetical protein